MTARPTAFEGSTNTGSDEVYHDVRVLLRPHIKDGPSFKV